MDLIYTEPYDAERGIVELGTLSNCKIDVEIGTLLSNAKNDFEIILYNKNQKLQKGSLIYANDDSEIGGIVYGIKVNTSNNEITLKCKLWRGLLSDHAVSPPKNQDYFVFNGDANDLLKQLITDQYDGLIVAADRKANISLSVKVRYATVLQVIEDALTKVNARLHISFNGSQAVCKVVEIHDLSESICLDNDYGIPMIAEDSDNGYNHIIALGKGELANRQVIEMWRLPDGSIIEESSQAMPTGIHLRTYIYDYPSVESLEELRKETMRKMDEFVPKQSLEIDPGTLDVEIGDIVSASERMTGISMEKQITRKIIKGNIINGISYLTTEYKVGD